MPAANQRPAGLAIRSTGVAQGLGGAGVTKSSMRKITVGRERHGGLMTEP